MKWLLCALFLASTYTGPTTLTHKRFNELTINGPSTLNRIEAQTFIAKGPVEFHMLRVKKEATIEGPVSASDHGDFNALTTTGPFTASEVKCSSDFKATGPVDITKLMVDGNTEIIGPLNLQNSQLHDITITADQITLIDTEVGNMIIKPATNKQQILNLQGKTLVNGNITFESGNGVIKQDPTSSIKGNVSGGSVH